MSTDIPKTESVMDAARHAAWSLTRLERARTDLIKKSSEIDPVPEALYLFAGLLAEAVVLRIGHFADPAEHGGRSNLSILGLAKALGQNKFEERGDYKRFRDDAEGLIQHRHKVLGHRDMTWALEGNALSILNNGITLTIEKIGQLLNAIEMGATNSGTAYAPISNWDVGALVGLVQKGRAYQRLHEDYFDKPADSLDEYDRLLKRIKNDPVF